MNFNYKKNSTSASLIIIIDYSTHFLCCQMARHSLSEVVTLLIVF